MNLCPYTHGIGVARRAKPRTLERKVAMKLKQKPDEKVWLEFSEREKLSDAQIEQFTTYYNLLQEWNELSNLTAITSLSGILHQHFSDSLALRNFKDLATVTTMVDVGAGAGFPALPLKIMFPHLKVILIEVTQKKQRFLQEVVNKLGLENVEICPLDWRTFLRTTEGDADLFVTRAALDEVELSRLFRATCPYRNADLVYWASKEWECEPIVAEFLQSEHPYKNYRKDRKLAFFKAQK